MRERERERDRGMKGRRRKGVVGDGYIYIYKTKPGEEKSEKSNVGKGGGVRRIREPGQQYRDELLFVVHNTLKYGTWPRN